MHIGTKIIAKEGAFIKILDNENDAKLVRHKDDIEKTTTAVGVPLVFENKISNISDQKT